MPRSKNFVLVDLISLGESLVEGEDDPSERRVGLAMFCILGMFYGVIHLALWNHTFPSRAESIMWKIAVIELLAALVLGVLFSISPQYHFPPRASEAEEGGERGGS